MSILNFRGTFTTDPPLPTQGFFQYGLNTGEIKAAIGPPVNDYITLGQTITFGADFNQNLFDGNITTTAIEPNLLTALDLNVNVPAGNYIAFCTYGWNHDAANTDYIAEWVLDPGGSETVLMRHQQEPKDVGGGGPGGTDQLQRVMDFHPNLVLSGAHTFRIRFGTSDAGDDSTIFNPRLALWRIS